MCFSDCPQVNVIHNYQAQQSDELSLVPGDVVNVLRKLTDGKIFNMYLLQYLYVINHVSLSRRTLILDLQFDWVI